MLLNCGVGEDSRESLELQGDPTSPSSRRSVLGIHWKTDAEAETPILWPPDEKKWVTGKDLDAGKYWEQEERGTTEDEMVGWHHRLNGHRSGWTPGVGDGQGILVCYGSWGCKELDTTEQLNWTERSWVLLLGNKSYSSPTLKAACHSWQHWPSCYSLFEKDLALIGKNTFT